ncbi:MAG: hypothetical protein ABSA75_13430 [Candidatus Bathyarchaeia archaeon]
MTEEPQPQVNQADELLKAILAELRLAKEKNEKLETALTTLNQKVASQDETINNFAVAVETGFKKRDEAINNITQATLNAPQVKSGGMGDAIGKIADVIEKAISGGGNNGGGFVEELRALNEGNIKSMLQLQKLDFQALISDRAKKLGLPTPADHMTVE